VSLGTTRTLTGISPALPVRLARTAQRTVTQAVRSVLRVSTNLTQDHDLTGIHVGPVTMARSLLSNRRDALPVRLARSLDAIRARARPVLQARTMR
jgi:hypothetical protein